MPEQYDPLRPPKPINAGNSLIGLKPMPVYPDPQLPDWIRSPNNPRSRDINSIGSTLSERTLSVSPHGTYVPVVYGNDYVGPILSLIHVSGYYLYIRFVWCVGEIEEITQIEFQDGSNIPGVTWNHYTGTSGQGVDALLSGAIPGYSDTMTNLGPDGVNVAYSVGRFTLRNLDTFPRVRAKIKGLKVDSPVPVVETFTAGAGGGSSDDVSVENGLITAVDKTPNGVVEAFIRYYETDLIDGDTYRFKIEVEEYNNQGSGTAPVTWAGETLLDDDSNPVIITGAGTYEGSASRITYDGTYNALKIVVNGNSGVQLKFRVNAWNQDGNTVNKYSNNAGLFLNHLLTDSTLGLGLTADLESLAELVNRNDEVLSTTGYNENRSHIGIVLKQKKELSQTIEAIRGYARTKIYNQGGVIRYVPNKPLTESFTITNSEIKPNSLRPSIRDFRNVPNVVRVYYTDTYTDPWRDNFVEVLTTEAENGTEPRREARYNMPALQSKPAAIRVATELLNERLRTFDVKFRAHQSVYEKFDGETFTLDTSELQAPYKMRLVNKKKTSATEYEIFAEKEDDNIYSNEIADYDPGSPVLIGDDPTDVTEITGLSLALETPEFQTGIYFSRIRVTWTETVYGYNHAYKIDLLDNSDDSLIETKQAVQGSSECVFNNIQEGVEYRVEVTVLGWAGNVSTVVSDTITPTGKDFPPSDVPEFTVYQQGGVVTCQWEPAADNQEVWYYEIQFGPSGFTWDDINSRSLVSRTDALEFTSSAVPPGTWDFKIKAVDNAGNLSTNATTDSSVIVSDNGDLYDLKKSDLQYSGAHNEMVRFPSNRVTFDDEVTTTSIDVLDAATKTGSTWAEMFPNAMNTYTTKPVLCEGVGVADCYAYTDTFSWTEVVSAFWSLDSTESESYHDDTYDYTVAAGEMIEVLQGTPEIKLQLSYLAGFPIYDEYNKITKYGSYRYARIIIKSTSADDRWIFRAGKYRATIKQKIKTEYDYLTSITGPYYDWDLTDGTKNLQFFSANVSDNDDYYATFEPLQTGDTVYGIRVAIRDGATGVATAATVNLNIIARYT